MVPGDVSVVPRDAYVVPGDVSVVPRDAYVVPGDSLKALEMHLWSLVIPL